MLHEKTKEHISNLSDAALFEYVLIGTRMYEPEALAFAREILKTRNLSPEQTAQLRPAIIANLAEYDAHNPVNPIRPTSASAIVCQNCGCEVPNRFVEYHQNIGALIVRFSRSYSGYLCKSCNRRLFSKCTLITFFFGWWGVISFPVTFGFLIGNVISFLRTLTLPSVPHAAAPPQLDDAATTRIAAHMYSITEKLTLGVDIADIAREIAPHAGVTPGQAWCFIDAAVRR